MHTPKCPDWSLCDRSAPVALSKIRSRIVPGNAWLRAIPAPVVGFEFPSATPHTAERVYMSEPGSLGACKP